MMNEYAVLKGVLPILDSEISLKSARQARLFNGKLSQTNFKVGLRVQSINGSREPSPKTK